MSAVRVAHVPGDHAYVAHSTRPVGSVPDAGGSAGLDLHDVGGWLDRHGDGVDVVHAHFGWERCTVAGLERVLLDLDRHGLPLVWTAHDLTNPHLVDQGPHLAQLGLLARHAAGVITLTRGAAEQIERTWGRRAAVVAHPHLAPVPQLARPRPAPRPGSPAVVGVPLGLLRPATDRRIVLALLDAFAAGAGRGPSARPGSGPAGALADAAGRDVRLRVVLREETLAAGFPRPDADLVDRLRAAEATGAVELQVGGRVPESALWGSLRELEALVLPYRWGSHSGWVEACHDVGTPVVAPLLGHWSEQHPVHGFASGEDGPDEAALLAALGDALAAGPRAGTVSAERLQERHAVVARHTALHTAAAAGGRW